MKVNGRSQRMASLLLCKSKGKRAARVLQLFSVEGLGTELRDRG